MTSHQHRKSAGFKTEGLRHKRNPIGWGYTIIWEFGVRPGMARRFEKMYGAKGDWARLFSQDESYAGTELIRSGRTYLTLDFWTSQEAYNEFRKEHRVEYSALDGKCEAFTESEREIGRFVRVSSP
jgi:hypothetical protein